MVSESNVELIRQGFVDLAAGGYEAMLPLIAPDFELTTPPGLAAEPDTYRGPGGMTRYFESFYEAMDEQEAVMAWKLRDGRAVRLEVFAELEEALAAVEKHAG